MKQIDVDDLILNYDPEFPQARFVSAGLEGALKSSTGRLPSATLPPGALDAITPELTEANAARIKGAGDAKNLGIKRRHAESHRGHRRRQTTGRQDLCGIRGLHDGRERRRDLGR